MGLPFNYQGWPTRKPFAESMTDSLGQGSPDFPSSAGDRERGKFRPGSIPQTTTVAVANDDGSPIGFTDNESSFSELAMELRAIRLGIQLLINQSANADINLIDMASNE